MSINFSQIIDLLELAKERAPLLIDQVLEIFDNLEQIADIFGSEVGLDPAAVGGPLIHRKFTVIVKNRTILKATKETGKSWSEISDVYDQRINKAMLLQACTEVGIEPPLATGNFGDWLKSIDWQQVMKIAFKLFMALLPFLLMETQTTQQLPVAKFQLSNIDDLRSFYTKENQRVQSMHLFISDLSKHGANAATELIMTDDVTAQKLLATFNKG